MTTSPKEQLQTYMKDDIKSAIITLLRIKGTLNLKQIAELMDKAESTLFPHVNALKENIIELDPDATNKRRGKYYRLTQQTLNILEQSVEELIQDIENRDSEEFKAILDYENDPSDENRSKLVEALYKAMDELYAYKATIESVVNLNRNIQLINVKKLMSRISLYRSGSVAKDQIITDINLKGSFSALTKSFPVYKISHAIEFSSILGDFLKKIRDLENKIMQEIKHENIPDNEIGYQYVYLFTSPFGGPTFQ